MVNAKELLTVAKSLPVEPELFRKLFRQILEVRLFEEETIQLFHSAKIIGYLHPSIGNEAAEVGASAGLAKAGHHLPDPPGARLLRRPGGQLREADGRADGPGGGVLQGALRRPAHGRPGGRHHAGPGHPRLAAAPGGGHGGGPPVPEERESDPVRLRRRRRGQRHLPREPEPGLDLEAARRVLLREQRLGGLLPLHEIHLRRDQRHPGRRLQHARLRRGRNGRVAGVLHGQGSRRAGPRRRGSQPDPGQYRALARARPERHRPLPAEGGAGDLGPP